MGTSIVNGRAKAVVTITLALGIKSDGKGEGTS